MNDIGIIVIDYQSDPLLDQALMALANSALSSTFKVVVVENRPRRIHRDIPKNIDIQFLTQKKNLGFGRAVNLARRQLHAPYLFILNPDVQVFQNTISILHDFMKKNSQVGLVVPKLLDPKGNVQASARKFYDLPTIFCRRSFLGKLFPDHQRLRDHIMADWDHMTIREIDWALGACMMIRTEAVPDEVFDPRFFLYFEDVDLCLRLKKAGWKVVYHPEAAAVHEHRQKSRKNPFSRANYEHFKSWVKFILKYRNISGIE